MMTDLADLQQLKKILHRAGLFPKKSLGQHFLVNQHVLSEIVSAAELKKSDQVLEVGAGLGILSQRLAPLVRKLLCLDIDKHMVDLWKTLMKDFPQAEIRHQDVLQFVPEHSPYKLVANIPYFITSPILKHFLREQKVRRPDLIVLMIQKEVAQRICDEKKPTLLSWEVRIFGKPEIICFVPARSFFPPPKVDSAVLRIQMFDQPLLLENDLKAFFQLLALCYHQPRKTLWNNFLASGKWSKDALLTMFKKARINPTLRPHQLQLEDWERLFREY